MDRLFCRRILVKEGSEPWRLGGEKVVFRTLLRRRRQEQTAQVCGLTVLPAMHLVFAQYEKNYEFITNPVRIHYESRTNSLRIPYEFITNPVRIHCIQSYTPFSFRVNYFGYHRSKRSGSPLSVLHGRRAWKANPVGDWEAKRSSSGLCFDGGVRRRRLLMSTDRLLACLQRCLVQY